MCTNELMRMMMRSFLTIKTHRKNSEWSGKYNSMRKSRAFRTLENSDSVPDFQDLSKKLLDCQAAVSNSSSSGSASGSGEANGNNANPDRGTSNRIRTATRATGNN